MQELYFVYRIGFIGPIILSFITIFSLWNQQKYLYSYLVFSVGNTILNKVFKNILKQERPTNSKKIMNEHYVGSEIYGMPSGHAQSAFFSISFLYFAIGSTQWILIEVIIVALTLYQRWKYRQHTIEQLFAGSLLGILSAYCSIYIVKHYI